MNEKGDFVDSEKKTGILLGKYVCIFNVDFSNNMINNRPVLLWANGSTITATQMKSPLFAFKVKEVYKSTLISWNVEDAIQTILQPLELGSRRLHRSVGKGERYANKLGLARCHRVFLTTSTQVQDLLKNKIMIVNN